AMRPDPATEARLFGKLALRGVVPREAVAELFAAAQAAAEQGRPVGLSSLALQRGLIDEERLLRYFRTDGDEVPALPGYEVLRKLGEGGTARVYQVRRLADGQAEALKLLHPELAAQPASVKAFLAEAALLKRLEHENVVKGHRAGRFGEHYLSFMECVEGRTLQELIAAGGAFDEDGALYVILQVARALEYLRGQGLVHRDIKPGNILVTPDNRVKVIDLGFAASGAGAGAAGGTTAGTAAFLSPEQAQGRADLDVRSDIYSLGATLYQMVLGELPFRGDDAELVQKAVLEGLSAAATKGGRISAHMHYFIEKMMAKDREIRYQSPQELMADIEDQIAGKRTLEVAPPPQDEGGGALRALHEKRRQERLRRRRGR
ncbi:MAG TPA: serine/threonine-protein kinase, partial [Planctomycetota bacterium]|nr:serine/threonine-protein kinase [Planctomycetota bacterium]